MRVCICTSWRSLVFNVEDVNGSNKLSWDTGLTQRNISGRA